MSNIKLDMKFSIVKININNKYTTIKTESEKCKSHGSTMTEI